MPTTPRGFRYPIEDDAPDVPRDLKNLAEDIDAMFISGPVADRPAPGKVGRRHADPATGLTSLDIGSAWILTGANDLVRTGDARLSDARTPKTHAATHGPQGSDPLPWQTVHGSGLYADRPAASNAYRGYLYFAEDTGGLFRCNGVAGWSLVSQLPILVSALPTDNLYEGREVKLYHAGALTWGFRYRAKNPNGSNNIQTYKWDFTGGTPYIARSEGELTWNNPGFPGLDMEPGIMPPVNGDYRVDYGATVKSDAPSATIVINVRQQTTGKLGAGSYHDHHIAGAATTVSGSTYTSGLTGGLPVFLNLTGSGNVTTSNRFLSITPLRVG